MTNPGKGLTKRIFTRSYRLTGSGHETFNLVIGVRVPVGLPYLRVHVQGGGGVSKTLRERSIRSTLAKHDHTADCCSVKAQER